MVDIVKQPGRLRRAPENFLSEAEIKAVGEGRRDFLRKSFLTAAGAAMAAPILARASEGDANILQNPEWTTTLGQDLQLECLSRVHQYAALRAAQLVDAGADHPHRGLPARPGIAGQQGLKCAEYPGREPVEAYKLLPVFARLLPADREMRVLVDKARAPHLAKLNEKLAVTEGLLYRRGNFNDTFDQLILDALIKVKDAEIAFSPGFRWGTSLLPG